MRLEIGNFRVRDIRFSGENSYSDGVLFVNPACLESLLREGDKNITHIIIDIARPTESARIVHVLDAIEPRVKLEGPGCVFPGFLGKPETVGEGRTARLEGVSVIETCEFPPWKGGLRRVKEKIIDMSGDGAPYSPFSETINLVLSYQARDWSSPEEAESSIRMAGLKTASFLGEIVSKSKPDQWTTYELFKVKEPLPRIVYVYQLQSQGPLLDTFLYGKDVGQMIPTIIHPNETMDGAIVSGNHSSNPTPTYAHQNNPVIEELYMAHGKEIIFAGVVLTEGHNKVDRWKERTAHYVTKLARLLKADGVVLTQESGGGVSMTDQMLICRFCENAGIKTALVTFEVGGTTGRDFPFLTFTPEADAIVSVGNREEVVQLPRVDKVCGGTKLEGFATDARDAFDAPTHLIHSSTNPVGLGRLRARQY